MTILSVSVARRDVCVWSVLKILGANDDALGVPSPL